MRDSHGVRHIVLFTRFPRPGTAKTRLVPALGSEKAALLARRMAEHAAEEVRACAMTLNAVPVVSFDGASLKEMRLWLGSEFTYHRQEGDDLGLRMSGTFRRMFESGSTATVLVGSDIPDIRAEILLDAFRMLESSDLVLGPTSDGGYYLVGLRRHAPLLFQGIRWSGASVLKETLNIAGASAMTCRLLRTLTDIDRPHDLELSIQPIRNWRFGPDT